MIQYPCSTVITVSRHAANRIHNVVLSNLPEKSILLGYGTSDCKLGKIPIYKGMRVYMVTQNRDKPQVIVNGRIAHVAQMQGQTVFLKLTNNNVAQVYPVTTKKMITLCKLPYQSCQHMH